MLETVDQGFSWKGLAEDVGTFAAGGAAIGLAAGSLPGAAIGAGLGAIDGMMSYLTGLFVSKAAQGLGASKETATAVRRVAEFVPALFSLNPFGLESKMADILGAEARGLFKLTEKMPTTAKYAVKSAMTGATIFYIAEPYDEEGEHKALGLAALTSLGLLAAHEYEPFIRLSWANFANLLSQRSPHKFLAPLVDPELKTAKRLLGKDVEIITGRRGLNWGLPGLAKEDLLDIQEGFSTARDEMRILQEKVSPAAAKLAELAKKHGWEKTFLFSDIVAAKHGGEMSEEYRNFLLEAYDKLEPEVKEALDEIAFTLGKASESAAQGLINLGGTSEEYISIFNSDKKLYVSRSTFRYPFASSVAEEKIEHLKELLKNTEGYMSWEALKKFAAENPEAFAREGMFGKIKRGKTLRTGKGSAFMERGIVHEEGSERFNKLTVEWAKQNDALALDEEAGKLVATKEVPKGAKIEYKGKTYTYGESPYKKDVMAWMRDAPLRSSASDKAAQVTMNDLIGTAFNIIDAEARTIKDLKFYEWLYENGRAKGLVSESQKAGFVNLDRAFQGKTNYSSIVRNKLGKLTGHYADPALARVVEYYTAMDAYTPKFESLSWINRVFKLGYLSYNFKTWANVFLGNTLLTGLNGLNPWHILGEYAAHRLEVAGAKKAEPLMEEATAFMERVGAVRPRGELSRREILELRKLQQDLMSDPGLPRSKRAAKKFFGAINKIVDGKFFRAYAEMHDAFRVGAYRVKYRQYYREFIKTMDKQNASLAAAKEASKFVSHTYAWFEDLPIVVRQIRDTVMPFAGFHFRLAPQVFKTAYQYPERFALMALMFEGLQRAAFKEQYGSKWAEGYKYEKLVNKEYMKPHLGGFMGHFIRVPKMGDLPSGYIQAHFVPWNLPFSVPQMDMDESPLSVSVRAVLFQNPVLRLVSGIAFNLDPATGRKISTAAGPGRVNASTLQYIFKIILPGPGVTHWLGEYFAKEGWLDFATSWFNYYGTYPDGTPIMTAHALYNDLLPTIVKYDPDYNFKMYYNRIKEIEHTYRSAFYKAIYQHAPREVLVDRAEDLNRVYDELWSYKIQLMERYTAALGK